MTKYFLLLSVILCSCEEKDLGYPESDVEDSGVTVENETET